MASTPPTGWLARLRWCALAVFVALPIFAYGVPSQAGRVVWTIAVAALPMFIVLVGYHRWRDICPLAWLAQLASRLGRPGQRRVSGWWQANYYYTTFGFLFASLWLRLVATNGHGTALASFLVLLSLAALAFGAMFTGKTWCNYVCPVSLVEKIYTEPRGLRSTPNSQCAKCTACKPACPDINQENGYWKEIRSAPKRFAYFAFPGLVFSFYFYFYLQSGTWDYYFGGRWTNEPDVLRSAFLPGHDPLTAGFFFLPSTPRALSALLTLALGALLSFGLFRLIEQFVGGRLRRRGVGMDEASVRHLMFTTAAFVAFITFYAFAGAPTLRLIAGVPHLFQVFVVATATLFLARRFARRQRAFAEETLARQIIRRWEWADVEPPKDLHEAFLIHTIRTQTRASGHARLLEIYKEAVREAVASGMVSRAEVQRLESLRNQLQISPADHEKVMADLDEEERARITDPALQVSAEKRLQLESYARSLQNYLEGASRAGTEPDDSFIHHLRLEYGVTPEEHGAVLADLLARGQGIAPHVAESLAAIEETSHTLRLLRAAPTPAGNFLADALSRRRARAVEGLMRGLACAPEGEKNLALRDELLAEDNAVREAAVEALGERLAKAVGQRLKEARREAATRASARATLAEAVRSGLTSADPYVRMASIYVLDEHGAADEDALSGLLRDEHESVRETAVGLLARHSQPEGRDESGLLAAEKMIALRAVPLFSSLAPEDVASLARASTERAFASGEALCAEGESGDEVFVLLAGEVEVLRRDGGEERRVSGEKAGGVLGEMAVLDPAPRAATVRAGLEGARVLCLGGDTFREALSANPSVARGVIRALAQRLRGTATRPAIPKTPAAPARVVSLSAPGEK